MNFLFCTSTVKSYLNFPFLSLNMSREKNLQFEAGKLDWKIALLYFALIKVIAKCISWNASLKNLKKLRKIKSFFILYPFLPYWVNLLKCSEKVCSKPRKIDAKDIKFPWQS